MRTWAQVQESPEYKSLTAAEQDEARTQYFDRVVRPRVPAEDVALAREQFDADSSLVSDGKSAPSLGRSATPNGNPDPRLIGSAPASAGLSSVSGRRGGTRAEARPYVAPDPAISADPLSKPAPVDMRQPLIEQRGAPVSDEVMQATVAQLSAMPRAQRQAQAKRTDLPGWMQETVRKAVEQIDGADAAAQRVDMAGPSLESRTARAMRQGADLPTATAKATTDAMRGAGASPLQQATAGPGLLTGEEVTANKAEGEKLQRSSLAARGLYGAREGLIQGTAGLIAMGLRAAGDEETAKLYEKVGQGASVRAEAANELALMQEKARDAGILPSGPLSGVADFTERMGTGAANSVGQMLPGIAAGIATGNAGVGLAMMALPVFGQSYIDKRDAGGTPGMSAAYGGAMAALEIVGERYGLLPQALNAFKKEAAKKSLEEVPAFIERGIAAMEKRGLFSKPVGAFVRGQAGEQIGEQITGAGQYLLDGTAFGLDKPISLMGFIENARDTAVQTLLATGVMQAAGAGAKGALRGTRVAEDPNAAGRPASAPMAQPIPQRVEPTPSAAPAPAAQNPAQPEAQPGAQAVDNITGILQQAGALPEDFTGLDEAPQAAAPAAGRVDIRGLMSKYTGADGVLNGNAAAQAIVDHARQALNAGQSVTLMADGKPRNITNIDRGMMADESGQRWGTLTLMTDPDGKRGNSLVIGASPVEGEKINRNWSAFAPESGTLGIPRADMPQIGAEHRGAFVNFLASRGIERTTEELPADSLKPTQAEFSPRRVAQARERKGGDRSIIVSSDGYVIDGHHQWMAAREAGEPVKAIVLGAPAQDVLRLAHQFPSSYTAAGPKRANNPESADANRTDVGGNPGRGPADGSAGVGVGSVVQGQQPAAAGDGTAPGVGGGADERAGAVRPGPGRGNDALKPGATFTLDGKAWTVSEVKDAAVQITDDAGAKRMVARNGKTFGKIMAALQPAAAAPEPAQVAATQPATQGAQANEVTQPTQQGVQEAGVQGDAPANPQPPQAEKAEKPAPAEETPDARPDLGERWDSMSIEDRHAIAIAAGWATAKGGANAQGRAISKKAWAGHVPSTRKRLADVLARQPQSEATHTGPGEKPEAVTPAVVNQSLTTAADAAPPLATVKESLTVEADATPAAAAESAPQAAQDAEPKPAEQLDSPQKANQDEDAARPAKPPEVQALVDARKRVSVLKSLLKCLG